MKKIFIMLVAVMAGMLAQAAQYQKVTALNDIADGDIVLMANEAAGKVSGSCAGKYLYAADATFANGIATAEGATEITLTASGSSWKLKVGTKTIGNNTTDLNSEGKGSTTYTITFDNDGNVLIANTNTACGTFYFNAGSPRFKTYTSNTMAKIQLYKKLATPTDTIPTDTVPTDTIVPTPEGQLVTYRLLQNAADLHEGDSVFFGTPAKDFVLGQYVAGSNIKGVAATYSADRHAVTANDLNAYVVSLVDGKYVFTGSDGKYLYLYNTNKNLSSSTTLDNKAKWTVSIADDVATIKSAYSSTWTIYFNKTAPTPLFCTYSSSPKYDANLGDIVLYTNNAPAYQEKVLQPAMEVLFGGEAVGDTLDWGEVVYDDSFGTETAPYSEYKSLSVVGTDLSSNISVTLSGASVFSCLTSSLPAKGGTLGVNFETTNTGSYEAVLTISCDTLSRTIVLKAKAVREATEDPTTKPSVTLSVEDLTIAISRENETIGLDMFTFSAANLTKKLYVKWNKNNQEPTIGYGEIEMLVGDQEIQAGEVAQFDAPTVEETEVYVSVTAYGDFEYNTTLSFYSYEDKSTLAFSVDLPISIRVTSTPTGLQDVELRVANKVLHKGQVLILHGDAIYSVSGRRD